MDFSVLKTRLTLLVLGHLACLLTGCGTTRWSDTARTATEQMLISDAVDRAISRIDFSVLAGRSVFLEQKYIEGGTDFKYIVSTLRQHMLASGCKITEKREDAEFIVEARAAAVGTDRHDLLYGMPAVNLGGISPVPGVPTAIPEIALARRTDQQGVARLGVFAYHRETGTPVWQSDSNAVASKARDLWVFGAGPFQRGTIYEGTQFAGGDIEVPLVGDKATEGDEKAKPVRVTRESIFTNPKQFARKEQKPAAASGPRLAMQPDNTGTFPAPEGPLWEPASDFLVPEGDREPPKDDLAPKGRVLGPIWR